MKSLWYFHVALDAASPLFSWKGLDPARGDVHFMDAIHTSVTTAFYTIVTGAVGVYNAFADVNLYPNQGTVYQPACRGELCIPIEYKSFL